MIYLALQCEIRGHDSREREGVQHVHDFIFGSSTTLDRSTKHIKFDPTRVQTHDF